MIDSNTYYDEVIGSSKRHAKERGELREHAGNLRLALVKALIASGEQAYYSARCQAAANPQALRAVYLEACAVHGIEPTEIDS